MMKNLLQKINYILLGRIVFSDFHKNQLSPDRDIGGDWKWNLGYEHQIDPKKSENFGISPVFSSSSRHTLPFESSSPPNLF